MQQIDPYAVTRNTATYEAYRAYIRAAEKAGQPFVFWGVMVMCLATPFLMSFGGALRRAPGDWRWILASLLLAVGAGGVLLGVGFLRMARYRRQHPIPEEWRQIPRLGWPRGVGRKPAP